VRHLVASEARQTSRFRVARCRDVAQIKGMANKPSDKTSVRRKGNNDIGCVVAIDNETRKVF
jgi:hypothetical protein